MAGLGDAPALPWQICNLFLHGRAAVKKETKAGCQPKEMPAWPELSCQLSVSDPSCKIHWKSPMAPNAQQTTRLGSEMLYRAKGTKREPSGMTYFGLKVHCDHAGC